MKITSFTVTAAVVGIFGAATCFAQATAGSQPADASTPHQREAMGGKKTTMKECMDARAATTPGMSKDAMTKACDDQMKMQNDRTHMSTAPTTPAPK